MIGAAISGGRLTSQYLPCGYREALPPDSSEDDEGGDVYE